MVYGLTALDEFIVRLRIWERFTWNGAFGEMTFLKISKLKETCMKESTLDLPRIHDTSMKESTLEFPKTHELSKELAVLESSNFRASFHEIKLAVSLI